MLSEISQTQKKGPVRSHEWNLTKSNTWGAAGSRVGGEMGRCQSTGAEWYRCRVSQSGDPTHGQCGASS